MTKMISEAQAKRIARLWGGNHVVLVGGYVGSTTLALLKRGFLSPTEKTGIYPSGDRFVEHRVNRAGLEALAAFMAKNFTPDPKDKPHD